MDTSTIFWECRFDNCHAKLISLKKLLTHMRLVHGSEKNCKLRCNIAKCGKMYSTSESYRKHVEREHKAELDGYESYQQSSTSTVTADNDDGSESNVDTFVQSNNEGDLGQVVQLMANNVSMFVLQTREAHLLPKNTCQSIINDVTMLFNTFVEHYSGFILSRLEENGIDVSCDHALNNALLEHFFTDSIWDNVSSDARLKRHCKDKLFLIEAEEVHLGTNEITGKRESYQYVPIRKTLQHYIQHDDVWESINRSCVKECDVFNNYTDGSAFQNHPFFSQHPNALRLHLYVDDLEPRDLFSEVKACRPRIVLGWVTTKGDWAL